MRVRCGQKSGAGNAASHAPVNPDSQHIGVLYLGPFQPGTLPALGQPMNRCHFCGCYQDSRCPSEETHLPDCTGLDFGVIWNGFALCLMCTEDMESRVRGLSFHGDSSQV